MPTCEVRSSPCTRSTSPSGSRARWRQGSTVPAGLYDCTWYLTAMRMSKRMSKRMACGGKAAVPLDCSWYFILGTAMRIE
eukprot:9443858-Pyramimonas_sp.AAC.1